MDACEAIDTCTFHFRNDRVDTSSGYIALSYVNQYAVLTGPIPTPEQIIARAMGVAIPMDDKPHYVEVLEVGYGSISDLGGTLGNEIDQYQRYTNETASSSEAEYLHWDLVELIKAGKFNGADL